MSRVDIDPFALLLTLESGPPYWSWGTLENLANVKDQLEADIKALRGDNITLPDYTRAGRIYAYTTWLHEEVAAKERAIRKCLMAQREAVARWSLPAAKADGQVLVPGGVPA